MTTDEFQRAATAYTRSEGGPVASNRQRNQLYGLYKQATEGDINRSQPGFFEIFEHQEYRAWKALRGMPKEQAQRHFVELAKKVGFRDPGDSPVAWISNETWLREESWLPDDDPQRSACISDPRLITVADEARHKAPTIATSERSSKPPQDSPEEQRRRLADTPRSAAFHIYSPRWPLCCRRLSILVGFRGIDEVFESVLPEACLVHAESSSNWDDDPDERCPDEQGETYGGEHLEAHHALFHCGNCGGVYVSSHEP